MYSLLKGSKNMDFRRIPRPIRKLFEIQGNESKNCLKHRFFSVLDCGSNACHASLWCPRRTRLTLSIQRTIHDCMSEMLHFIHRLAMNTFLCRNSALRTLCVREEEMSYNQDDSTRAKSAIFL